MSNPPIYKGKLHSEGGIPVVVEETGQPIEVETEEAKLCSNIMNSSKVFDFKQKTNKEIISELHNVSKCDFEQDVANTGDFIICRKGVNDAQKRDLSGTARSIINQIQGEKGCKVEYHSGGEVKKEKGGALIYSHPDNGEYKGTGTRKEVFALNSKNILKNGGGIGKSPIFASEITKQLIQDVISGKSQVSYGETIQAAANYLRESQKTGYLAQGVSGKEEERLKAYITRNNLWVNSDLSKVRTEGNEQKVSFDENDTHVIKFNTGTFYESWADYLDSLLLHNLFFPDTVYELIGFSLINNKLHSVVRQPYIEATEPTDLSNVRSFLLENDFKNTQYNDYYNEKLEVSLNDLHEENVLTKDGVLYFVDTVFLLNENIGMADGGGIFATRKAILKQKIATFKKLLNYKAKDAATGLTKEDAFVKRIIDDIYTGKEFYSKVETEKIGREYGFTDKQKIKELGEFAVLQIARDIAKRNDLKTAYEQIVELYKVQPMSTDRSSVSTLLQQFSTPLPIAYIMAAYVTGKQGGAEFRIGYKTHFNSPIQYKNIKADSKKNALAEFSVSTPHYSFESMEEADSKTYFEPCVGNGALTVAASPESFVVNEIDRDRLNNLKKEPYKAILNQDANLPFPFEKMYGEERCFDGLVTNPPFGAGKDVLLENGYQIYGLEQQIAVRALRYMKKDFKGAILIGGHNEYDEKGRIKGKKTKAFLNYLASHFNMTDCINIAGELYSRQGTQFPIRVILLDGRKEKGGAFPIEEERDIFEPFSSKIITTFEELFLRVNGDDEPTQEEWQREHSKNLYD